MTAKVTTLDDGVTVEATTIDSIHTAIGGLQHVAKEAKRQEQNSMSSNRTSDMSHWVNYLKKVIVGPRGFHDPEGTLFYGEANNNHYQQAFGQTSPNAETVKNYEVVEKYLDGELTQIGAKAFEPQEAFYQPQVNGEPIPVLPEDLATAKGLVVEYVSRVIPEAEYMFKYMAGDESALPAANHIDTGNGSTDDYDQSDMSRFCSALQELGEVKGIGPYTLQKLQKHLLMTDNEIILDPKKVQRDDLTVDELFDSQGDYIDKRGIVAAQELKEKEPKLWENLGR